MQEMAKRGRTDMYETLAIQNMFNAIKERVA